MADSLFCGPAAAILCDATSRSGLGHASRCAVLGLALGLAGTPSRILLLPGSDAVIFRKTGLDWEILPETALGAGLAGAVMDRLSAARSEVLLADAYSLPRDFFAVLAATLPDLPVLAWDDFGEKAGLPVLGVVNTGLGAAAEAYPGRMSLFSALGPDYACLPPACLAAMPRAPRRDGKLERLLLVMGASDPERQTARLVRLLTGMPGVPIPDVVLGPHYGPAEEELLGMAQLGRLRLHRAPAKFHALAATCDLAVTGAGGTCLEFLHLGLPLATLVLADNQEPGARALEDRGLGFSLGRFDRVDDAMLQNRLRAVLAGAAEREARAARGRSLFDGQGADRLACKLAKVVDLFHGRGFSIEEVAQEYDEASLQLEPYRKAMWGSDEGMRNRFRLAAELLGTAPLGRWLDVGCGPGDFLPEVEKRLHPDSYVGLDFCDGTLDFAAARSATTRERTYRRQDFLDPVPGEPFDCVTSLGVLHKCGHDLHRSVRRLAGLVAPGGRLLATTKNLDWEAFDTPGCIPYPGHAWFRQAQLEKVFRDAGLRLDMVRGFEPRSGAWTAPRQSHSLMLLASKEARP